MKELLLNELKTNNQRIFDTGHSQGLTDVIEKQEAFLTDKPQSHYDAFWDIFQNNGARVNYANAFGGEGWTDKLFKPKYDILPTDAYMMFRSSSITDLVNLPVKLDFSNATNFQYMFQWAKTRYIGNMDMQKATNVSGMFSYCYYLKKINKLIFKEDGTQKISSDMFTSCPALTDIIIEGVIGTNGFNMQWSTKLSKTSIESIINALSATTSGLTVTFSKTAVNNAFGINIDDESTYTDEWNTLRNSKSNWTFAYN